MKPFTPEQLQGNKEDLANLSIKIEAIEDEKKASASYFKEQLKPLTEQRTEIIRNIRQKSEYVNEICYKKARSPARTRCTSQSGKRCWKSTE
jgi:hypothetical protein